jgi:hypothetical protein
MGSLLRRTLLVLLAAVFVVAGIGRGMAAMQPCPSTVHETAAHHSHGEKRHHTLPHDQAAIDQSCMKCCGICVAIASGDFDPADALEMILFSILYSPDSDIRVGQLVNLDPGIPKTFC